MVAESHSRCRRLFGEVEEEEGEDEGDEIADEMDGVGDDGDGVCNDASHNLSADED